MNTPDAAVPKTPKLHFAITLIETLTWKLISVLLDLNHWALLTLLEEKFNKKYINTFQEKKIEELIVWLAYSRRESESIQSERTNASGMLETEVRDRLSSNEATNTWNKTDGKRNIAYSANDPTIDGVIWGAVSTEGSQPSTKRSS